MQRRATLAVILAAMAAAPQAPAAASVSGFELPPSPTETPEVQGPVAEGVAAPRVVRPEPTPTPTPTPSASPSAQPPRTPAGEPTEAPSPRPQASGRPPLIVPPAPPAVEQARPAAGADQERAPATTAPSAEASSQPAIESAPSQAGEAPAAAQPVDAAPSLQQLPTAPQQGGAQSGTGLSGLMPGGIGWLAALAALLAAVALGGWIWWRKREDADFTVPVIARPRISYALRPFSPPRPEGKPIWTTPPKPKFGVPSEPQPAPASPPAPAPAPQPALAGAPAAASAALAEAEDPAEAEDTLSFSIEARQLAISLTAATLSYRITLTNSGNDLLPGVAIAGDMISAHASRAQDEQIAGPTSTLAPCHNVENIPAGKSVQVTGEFRLPLTAIQPIRRGDLALFVPLARLRVDRKEGGGSALVKTALIGQRSTRPGAGLQPFRLDLGPRIYKEVTQKIFS